MFELKTESLQHSYNKCSIIFKPDFLYVSWLHSMSCLSHWIWRW